MMSSQGARVLCDWGGSHLRAYLEVDGAICAERSGPGIGTLAGQGVMEALRAALDPWTATKELTQVYLCGMAGSRNGLLEVPYCASPASVEAWSGGCAQLQDGPWLLTIAPGVQGLNLNGRPDVIRGEETQVFGAQVLRPQLGEGRQLFVLPGTHSKWIETTGGRIGRFQTVMTGELFALLCEHSSLLRVSSDEADLEAGLEAGFERGACCNLGVSLFETRAAQLLEGRTRGWARGYLSGLLIAAEVRTLLSTGFGARELTLIGDPQLTALYGRALERQNSNENLSVLQLDGTACVLAGLGRLTDPH